jgi:signal transduction histidine kinase
VAANERLAALAATADELATSRERNRLAREIHDSLGHYLTAMGVQLEVAERDLAGASPSAAALERVRRARAMARDGLADVRRSVAALRGSALGERSLATAVGELVAAARAAAGATGIEQRVEGTPRTLAPDAALTIYRAVQEGLTNALRHSRAARVEVLLDYRAAETVRAAVVDDGVGAVEAVHGFGLTGLRERARSLGGRVGVESTPGEGFALEIEVPA